ncbi:pentapeptide repeat-containing protein [Microbispora sp. NPDC046973]|uniref:pentapeptide repeat-containing protein n=1 Tax=Microbispora sp. NPDC046973 TaxID=3155022 RepID=UPI00340C6AB5
MEASGHRAVDLRGARLRGARLRGARLRGAHGRSPFLVGTRVTGVRPAAGGFRGSRRGRRRRPAWFL